MDDLDPIAIREAKLWAIMESHLWTAMTWWTCVSMGLPDEKAHGQ